MKKRFGVIALAAAAGCAVIFSGCAGCAGCGAAGKTNEAAFSSNWYADTSFPYIQPTFINGDKSADFTGREEVTYNVTLDRESAGNTVYSVEYGAGTYTTLFYATRFDRSLICEEYREAYPENLTVYYYKTELNFDSVTFKMLNDANAVKTFDEGESIVTECYFTDVAGHLRPLYATIEADNHNPADFQPNALEYTYQHVKQSVTTSYNFEGTAAKTIITDRLDESKNAVNTVENLGDTQNSLIDVCGLNIAVRAMQLSTTMAQTISVYSPADKMQNYTFSGSPLGLSDDEKTAVEGILTDAELYVPADEKHIETVCVTAAKNADMSGGSQRYWFAAIDNAKNNRGRATMVKMSAPVPFSLGVYNYELKKINSTLYNK